jgi:predicted nucleotidyltransferase
MKTHFSTHLIDSALKKKKQQREEVRLKFIARVMDVLDELSQKVFFKEAYIFGSLIKREKFSGASDIDVGFIGLKDKDFFQALAFLSRELACDVDIMQLEGHKYKEKILREGIRWKKKG